MNAIDINARRKFTEYYNLNGREIINQIKTDHTEIVFELSDGSRILYDEINDKIIPMRELEEGEYISEKEWIREFSRRLNKMMKLRRISQKQLANMIGVTEHMISRYVNGKSVPKPYIIQLISRSLRCSTTYLTNFDYLL